MKISFPFAFLCVFVVVFGLVGRAGAGASPPSVPIPRVEDIDCTTNAQCAEFGLTCCRSTGKCFDAAWQVCCTSGVVCAAEYEECCNTTCCNKYNSRCIDTERLGVPSAQVCSATQWLSPQRGFMAIGIPIIFLLAAFTILLLTIYLIQTTSLSRLEIAICFPAYYGVICGCCLIFSPLWVYGSLTFLFSLAGVAAACSRASFPVAFVICLQHFLFMIYTNPYSPNSLLTIGQTPGGIVEEMRLMVDGAMLQLPPGEHFNGYCPTYYFGYWERDPIARDFRIHNPLEKYFGYCSKEWLTALHIFMTIEVGAIVVLQALLAARWAGLSTWFRRLYEIEVSAVTRHHEGAHTVEVKHMH